MRDRRGGLAVGTPAAHGAVVQCAPPAPLPRAGTLFRFPLRTAAAAAVSDIKSTPCTPGEVRALLEAFR